MKQSTIPDPYTSANSTEITSYHFDLDLFIDFDNQIISGSVTHSFRAIASNVDHIILDTRFLSINKIYNTITKESYKWEINPFKYIKDVVNSQLEIKLDKILNVGEELKITIEYATAPEATAVNWVPKEQTFGKNHKFVFTQCETIQCRSIVSIQDTPSVKSTYNAKLKVAEPYLVLASAVYIDQIKENGFITYNYKQTFPMPSYLLAIVAGNIVKKNIGKRCVLYSEPEILEKSAKELEDIDIYLDAIEGIITPYLWGHYGVVIMPPSFPIGGMENPYITFVSPSIIVGDKSSAIVVAHEICHSWFGNQVTSKNWNHIWLNESFTNYAEFLIVRKVHGEQSYKAQCRISVDQLKDAIDSFRDTPEYTKLCPNVIGDDPENLMNIVIYVKGFLFLKYLEKILGNERFYEFLRYYLTELKYKSIESWEMKEVFESYVRKDLDGEAKEILPKIEWDRWLCGEGLPHEDEMNYEDEMIDKSIKLADYYIANAKAPDNKDIYNKFPFDFKLIFIHRLLQNAPKLTEEILLAIDNEYKITSNENNPEILSVWLRLIINTGSTKGDERAEQFLKSIGRQKFTIPIYTAYSKTRKEFGKALFEKCKALYHPIAVNNIQMIFKK